MKLRELKSYLLEEADDDIEPIKANFDLFIKNLDDLEAIRDKKIGELKAQFEKTKKQLTTAHEVKRAVHVKRFDKVRFSSLKKFEVEFKKLEGVTDVRLGETGSPPFISF